MNLRVGKYLHYVAAVETCLDRGEQLIVDAGILGMESELGVHLKGEIHDCGALGEDDWFALRGEGHDVVVVKRTHYLFDKTCSFLSAGSDVAQYQTEFF